MEIDKKLVNQRNSLIRGNRSSGKICWKNLSKSKKMASNIRVVIRKYIFYNQKSKLAPEILGIDRERYKEYLKKKFKKGMTLENYGKVWHIDHIKPSSSFTFRNNNDLKKCFNYKNTQPLFKSENLSKFDSTGNNIYLYKKDIKKEFKEQNFTVDQIKFLAINLPILYTINSFKKVLRDVNLELGDVKK